MATSVVQESLLCMLNFCMSHGPLPESIQRVNMMEMLNGYVNRDSYFLHSQLLSVPDVGIWLVLVKHTKNNTLSKIASDLRCF